MTSKARQLAQSASAPEGRKNIVINGAMNVCQRATSKSGLGANTDSGYHVQDRFDLVLAGSTAGRFTMSQDTDAPSGFGAAMKLDCTTADTSIAADEFFAITYQIEGQDLQQLAKGTSDAKQLTVSFFAKANASKTYVVELKDHDNTRTCSQTYTVGTSYSRIELTFPVDTTGELDDDNARSFAIIFYFHVGSTYTSGTLQTAWGSQTTANRAVGCESIFSSTDNTFFMTGLQMEIGSVATEFEHRSFAEELALCQRYYQKFEGTTTNYESITVGYNQGSGNHVGVLYTNVPMRSTGIALETTGTASDYVILHQSQVQNLTSVPVLYAYASIPQNDEIVNVTLTGTTGSGLTAQGGSILSFTNSAGKTLAIEDEL